MPDFRRNVAVYFVFISSMIFYSTVYAMEGSNIRGSRYCEVIVARAKLELLVYSTLGMNECPDELWRPVTTAQIKKSTKSFFAYLNGPRYLVADGFVDPTPVGVGAKKFSTISMQKAATVHLNLLDLVLGARPYRKHNVLRKTVWFYKKERPVFELINPKGQVFVMQSYTSEKVPLTQDSLASLGSKLKLPKGWTFKVGTLKADKTLKPSDHIVVLMDDLFNMYQWSSRDFL